jgi:hypothetical protein
MAKDKDTKFDASSDYDFDAMKDFESTPSDSGTFDDDGLGFGSTSAGDSQELGFGGTPEFESDTSVFSDNEFAKEESFSSEFSGPDPFGGDGFGFSEPPSPQSVAHDSLTGNPDEEFADFGSSDDDQADFDATSSKSGEPMFGAENDPFDYPDDDGASNASQNAAYDPFNTENVGDFEDRLAAEPETVVEQKTGLANLKQYAVGGVAALVVGYIGYTQVLPMFVGGETTEIAAPVPTEIPSGNLPVALPPMQQTQPPQEVVLSPEINELPVATQPVAQELPSVPPAQVDAPVVAEQGNQPLVLDPPQVDTNLALIPVDAQPTANTAPVDELVDSTDRGGIATMKEAGKDVGTVGAPSVQLEEIASKLDAVVKRIDVIEEKVAALSNTSTSLPVVAPTAPSATAAKEVSDWVSNGDITAPLKPEIIENATLRGVSRDVAWIAIGKDVKEYKVGDTVQDAGVIESFQNYRGRWIAVTSQGIILPR